MAPENAPISTLCVSINYTIVNIDGETVGDKVGSLDGAFEGSIVGSFSFYNGFLEKTFRSQNVPKNVPIFDNVQETRSQNNAEQGNGLGTWVGLNFY